MAELTEKEIEAAQRIVLSWDWQIAEAHNYSFKHGLHTLTRYYESAPMESDEFRLVLKYLKSQTDVELININQKGIRLDGEWKAKDAWYQTANGDHFEGTEQNRVRIYQTLVGKDDDGAEADGPYTVENGCKYRITHVFFWDVESLPSLDKGEYVSSSGVQYTMQGVTRDKETGLFSCVVERRETVQQDIDYYGSVTTIFEKREDAVHLGVKQANVEKTGDASSAKDGVLVERHLSKNPDCTTDVNNVKTTEKEVENAQKTYRKTLRGTIETTAHRNQKKALDGDNMAIGETRQTEQTPGGLHNNTTSKVTAEAAGKITASCTKTIYEHQHSELENQLEAPESDEVEAAKDGVIRRQTSRKTDEGTVDVETTTTTEQGVKNAVKRYRKTLRGKIETTVNRNQPAALDGDNMAVGEQRETEQTPGGLHNNTTSKVTAEAAGKITASCAKTIFEHQHSELENQLEAPESDEVEAAKDGVIHRQTSRKTEEGTVDVETTTTTEQGVKNAVKRYRKTLRGKIETTVNRNQPTALDGENMAVGEQRETEQTPGGLHNNTTSKITAEAAGTIAESCENQTLEHTDSKQENVLAKPESVEQTATVNQVLSKAARQTEEGSWDVITTTRTHIPAQHIEQWSDDSWNYALIVFVNAEKPISPSSGSTVTAGTTSYTVPESALITCNFTPNRHGSYDGSVHIRTRRDNSNRLQTLFWEKTENSKKARYHYFNRKGEMCYREFTCTHYKCYGPYRTVFDRCQDGEDLPCVGWHSGGRMTSVDTAFGDKYTNIQCGAEIKVDSTSNADQGGE